MGTKLTTTEAKRLAGYEATIRSGLNSWMDVSRALIAIHEEELWAGKAKSFTAYCKLEFHLSSSRAYQMIQSYEAADDVSTIVENKNPLSEGVAREISKVDTEQKRADVYSTAVETSPNKNPTAAHVAKVRKELFPEPKASATTVQIQPIEAIKCWIKEIDAIRREIDEIQPVYKTAWTEWKTALDELDEGRKALARLVK